MKGKKKSVYKLILFSRLYLKFTQLLFNFKKFLFKRVTFTLFHFYFLILISTLNSAFVSTRDYFLGINNYYLELANYMKIEVLDPSKLIFDRHNAEGKRLYTDIKKLDKDFKDTLTNLEKNKTKFFTMAKAAETAKEDSELAKLSYIPQAEKDKFFSKCNVALKDAKDAEKNYIQAINQANSLRIIYIEGSKTILQNYQKLEEEFIEFNKNILRKLFIFSNATLKSSLYDTEKAYLKVEEVDMASDIKSFIEKNDTSLTPPYEIEYLPYSISMRNKSIEETNYPLEVYYNVIVTIQSLFEKVADDYVSD
jgi:hypothetical protein